MGPPGILFRNFLYVFRRALPVAILANQWDSRLLPTSEQANPNFVLQNTLFLSDPARFCSFILFCIFHTRLALPIALNRVEGAALAGIQAGRVVANYEHMYHHYTIAGVRSHGPEEAGR